MQKKRQHERRRFQNPAVQERVRKDIVAWLNHLRTNVGYDGWRYDFTKGYCECPFLRLDHLVLPVKTLYL